MYKRRITEGRTSEVFLTLTIVAKYRRDFLLAEVKHLRDVLKVFLEVTSDLFFLRSNILKTSWRFNKYQIFTQVRLLQDVLQISSKYRKIAFFLLLKSNILKTSLRYMLPNDHGFSIFFSVRSDILKTSLEDIPGIRKCIFFTEVRRLQDDLKISPKYTIRYCVSFFTEKKHLEDLLQILSSCHENWLHFLLWSNVFKTSWRYVPVFIR